MSVYKLSHDFEIFCWDYELNTFRLEVWRPLDVTQDLLRQESLATHRMFHLIPQATEEKEAKGDTGGFPTKDMKMLSEQDEPKTWGKSIYQIYMSLHPRVWKQLRRWGRKEEWNDRKCSYPSTTSLLLCWTLRTLRSHMIPAREQGCRSSLHGPRGYYEDLQSLRIYLH